MRHPDRNEFTERFNQNDAARVVKELYEAEQSDILSQCEKARAIHVGDEQASAFIDGLIDVVETLVDAGSQSISVIVDLDGLSDDVLAGRLEPDDAVLEMNALSARANEFTTQSMDAARAVVHLLHDRIAASCVALRTCAAD